MSATKIVVATVGAVAAIVLISHLFGRENPKPLGEPKRAPVTPPEPLRLTHQKDTPSV